MIHILVATLFKEPMTWALQVKSGIRSQFMQTLVFDKEASHRFMDRLNCWLLDLVISASPFEELITNR